MAEKEKSKLTPDGHGGYLRTDLNERNGDEGKNLECIKKLNGKVFAALQSFEKVRSELVKGIDALVEDRSSKFSDNSRDGLAMTLVGLDFNLACDVLLFAHKNLAEGSTERRMIEKVSRMLLPWLYISQSQFCKGLLEKWHRKSISDNSFDIPAGFSTSAEIIMAGLNCREVVWYAIKEDNGESIPFPQGKYGLLLKDLLEPPESGRFPDVIGKIRQNIFKRIKSPIGISDMTLIGQDRFINNHLKNEVEDHGIQIYHMFYTLPVEDKERDDVKKKLVDIKKHYPYLGIIKLDEGFAVEDTNLLRKIRSLIVTEGQ